MSRWFRIDDDVVHDIKVQSLPADLFKAWINILCIASKNKGRLPSLEAVAFALRADAAKTTEILVKLVKAGLVDRDADGLAPHNWKERQFVKDKKDGSDTGSGTPAAIKSKKYRDKKRAGSATGSATSEKSSATGDATPPETEAETEAKTETHTDPKKEGSREVALVSSGWPADWFDQFWKKYPNKVDRAGAMKSLAKAAKKGDVEWSTIMDGLDRYVTKTDDRPWCNPTTWINQARWGEQHAQVTPHGKAKTGGSIIDALRTQAEFFQQQVDAERENADDLEAGGDDVLRLPAE